jgi:peroxiredoxin
LNILRLKSIFLTLAISYWFILTLWSLYRGLAESLNFGLLFSALIPFSFIAYLFIFKKARTSPDLKPVTFLLLGAIALVFEQFLHNTSLLLNMSLAAVSLAFWLGYVFWYSKFTSRENSALKMGERMPILSFIDTDGNNFSTAVLKGKKALYLFYRGNWCPLCMAQVKEIVEKYQELSHLNTELLLISPQPHKFTVNLAKRWKVPFHFLMDKENKVAKELGIFAEGGTPFGLEVLGYDSDTVLPTVIITNEKGKIIFLDQTDNYRVRPEPETFLEVLKNS